MEIEEGEHKDEEQNGAVDAGPLEHVGSCEEQENKNRRLMRAASNIVSLRAKIKETYDSRHT